MDNQVWNKRRGEIAHDLEAMKDRILQYQFEAGQNGDWSLAEQLFKLAQRLDEFSRETGRDVEKPVLVHGENGSANLDPDDYPIYRLENNALVRIGLSSDKTSEYIQKVPRMNFNEIVDKIKELARKERSFSADSVIRLAKQPAYQVYAVIGYLQEHGYLKNPRRGQYEFSVSSDLLDSHMRSLVWN